MSKSRSSATTGKGLQRDKLSSQQAATKHNPRATRETVESIAVAVILAFLFRAFVAEAFVIPTGSMAPTLQGRHMDVTCPKCGYAYRTGASVENDRDDFEVVATCCPICSFTLELDKEDEPNQRSFNGDRILVSKFVYEFEDPQRWDVIVFKYPGNAKQNYIKRLVGLPDETVRIRHGDIFYRKHADQEQGEAGFHIARKPPDKLEAMVQLVDDTDYRAPELTAAGWPERWQDWDNPDAPTWTPAAEGKGFATDGSADGWLRYRHVVPWDIDWIDVLEGRIPERLEKNQVQGQLISDYYAYNDGVEGSNRYVGSEEQRTRTMMARRIRSLGLNWVGDLAVEYDVTIDGDSGELALDLVEGGVHYTCRINVADGTAVMELDEGRGEFTADDGSPAKQPQATTKVHGRGSYELRFSNCDEQLLLWVNGHVVEFDGPTTYHPMREVTPRWSPDDPGDLEPAGIAARGVAAHVTGCRVYRDVYYVAATFQTSTDGDYTDYVDGRDVIEIFASPQLWESTRLFELRRDDVEFEIGEDQFFPLGDNSPQSRDARLWSQIRPNAQGYDPPPYVRRDLLTGRAVLIYWPHAWRRPIPFLPNFKRMGLIR